MPCSIAVSGYKHVCGSCMYYRPYVFGRVHMYVLSEYVFGHVCTYGISAFVFRHLCMYGILAYVFGHLRTYGILRCMRTCFVRKLLGVPGYTVHPGAIFLPIGDGYHIFSLHVRRQCEMVHLICIALYWRMCVGVCV